MLSCSCQRLTRCCLKYEDRGLWSSLENIPSNNLSIFDVSSNECFVIIIMNTHGAILCLVLSETRLSMLRVQFMIGSLGRSA